MPSRAKKPIALVLALLLAIMSFAPAAAQQITTEEAFFNTWARTDLPVEQDLVDRTWMWGPDPNTEIIREPYVDHPIGQREVQYWDKARMEVNDPTAPYDGQWYVTNGLLVVELMTGMLQVGDFEFEERWPADIHIAGDPDRPETPTYAVYGGLMDAAAFPQGSTITATVDAQGNVGDNAQLSGFGVTAAELAPETGHRTASVFWEFMNSTGPVWDWQTGDFTTGRLFVNPYYATGLPITEAYWAYIYVDNTQQWVLTQAFERRVLTYAPGNEPGWRVEAGNVGLHYYEWRYETPPPVEPGIEKFVVVADTANDDHPHGIPVEGVDVQITIAVGIPPVVGDVVFEGETDADGRIFAPLDANVDYQICIYSEGQEVTVDGATMVPTLPTSPDNGDFCEVVTVEEGQVTTVVNEIEVADPPVEAGIEKFVVVADTANDDYPDGIPVEGVDVQITIAVGIPPVVGDVVFEGETDADGRVFAPLDPGVDYNVCIYDADGTATVDGMTAEPDLRTNPDPAFIEDCEVVTVTEGAVTTVINEITIVEPVEPGFTKTVIVAGTDDNNNGTTPMTGVNIVVYTLVGTGVDGYVTGPVQFTGVTGADGMVAGDLSPGTYVLCIYDADAEATVNGTTVFPNLPTAPDRSFINCEDFTVVAGEVTDLVNEVVLFEQGIVKTVLNTEYLDDIDNDDSFDYTAPVADATVEVFDASGAVLVPVATGTTDASGVIGFTLDPGVYTVCSYVGVTADTDEICEQNIAVGLGETVTLTNEHEVEGIFEFGVLRVNADLDGEAFGDVEIIVYETLFTVGGTPIACDLPDVFGAEVATAETDEDGYAAFTLATGAYCVVADATATDEVLVATVLTVGAVIEDGEFTDVEFEFETDSGI
jgi:5-hydroxyisourate hydrolase-like protein (transthyretin family)